MATPHTHDHGSWNTHAADALALKGTRRSSARDAVVTAIAAQDCCASAQEIHARLRTDGSTIGIASVYRTLELLVSLGLVVETRAGVGYRLGPCQGAAA